MVFSGEGFGFLQAVGPWISPQTEAVFLPVRRNGISSRETLSGNRRRPCTLLSLPQAGGIEWMPPKNGNRKRREGGGRGGGGQRTGQVLHHRLDSPPPLGCPVWGPGQLSCRDQAAAASPATTAATAAGTPVSRQNCGSPSPPLASCLVQAAKNNPLGSMHQHQGSSSAGSTTGGWLEGKKALPVGGKLT